MNHKSFDFTQLGGFPLEQERLSWMQQSYTEALQAVSSLIGDNVIVSGCVVAGTNVTDGWVVVGGELLPFKGGVKQNTFSIRNITTSLEFEDASFKDVQFYKYCEFGTDNPISFDSLTRVNTIKAMSNNLVTIDNTLEALNKRIITGSVDFIWDDAELVKKVTIASDGTFDANDYVGFMNNRFSQSLSTSYYNANTDGSFYFVLLRTEADFSFVHPVLDYVLIKKQH